MLILHDEHFGWYLNVKTPYCKINIANGQVFKHLSNQFLAHKSFFNSFIYGYRITILALNRETLRPDGAVSVD